MPQQIRFDEIPMKFVLTSIAIERNINGEVAVTSDSVEMSSELWNDIGGVEHGLRAAVWCGSEAVSGDSQTAPREHVGSADTHTQQYSVYRSNSKPPDVCVAK